MANINFHIRKYYYYTEATDQLENAHAYWKESSNYIYNEDSYTNQDETFVLVPRIHIGGGGGTDYSPNTVVSVYTFRVANGNYSVTYPLDYDFGDINTTLADTLILATSGSAANQSYDDTNNNRWVNNGWTPGTFNTFKNEVTGMLAACINNSRSLTGSSVQPLSQYNDWNVHFYMNQIDGDQHIIVFYPGDDPQADETIVETV